MKRQGRHERFILVLLCSVFLVFSAGCGTLARFGQDNDISRDLRYTSTKIDWNMFFHGIPSGFITISPYNPLFMIDMPLAVVMDTLCFPADQCYYMSHVDTESYWTAVAEGKKEAPGWKSRYMNQYASCFLRGKIDNSFKAEALDRVYEALIKIESDDFVVNNRKSGLIGAIASCKNLQEGTYAKIFNLAESEKKYGLMENLARNPSTPEGYYRKLFELKKMGVMMSLACQNPATPQNIKDDIEAYAIEVKKNNYDPKKSYYDNVDYYTARDIVEHLEDARKRQQREKSK